MENQENKQLRVVSTRLTPLPLNSSEISMRQQASGEKISEMPINTLLAKLSNSLKEICLMTGLKVEEATGKEFTKLFAKFVLSHYGYLTAGELSLAFSLNAADELPTKTVCYGSNLTIEYVGAILSSYKQKRMALASKIALSASHELPTPELTKEQKESEAKEFCNEYYKKWLERDFSPVTALYAYMVYDTLDKAGIISLTVEEKKHWFAKAQEQRERELSAPSIDRQERKDYNRMMEAYMNNSVPQEEKDLVKNYAKKLALLDYFSSWKLEGKVKIFDI
ncbi:hypothetical protein ACFOTA_06770 [Chitinophaga sp. GCM10012297]|uniref:Uncharacterized protein n=1 Tax=Chitinophaga chungangae TaxID=2821488 RepID=A0ABS3YB54_9BACT|nr:hypothetical protein [Chitinophaga chungangae]MBO9151903.1 hypothetical protein [Chitinophaga chungangae]